MPGEVWLEITYPFSNFQGCIFFKYVSIYKLIDWLTDWPDISALAELKSTEADDSFLLSSVPWGVVSI